MIRVSVPFQSPMAQGLSSGIREGQSLIPDMNQIKQQELQSELMKAHLAQMQSAAPYLQKKSQADLGLEQYKLAHPSVMYGGPSQQLLLSQEAGTQPDTGSQSITNPQVLSQLLRKQLATQQDYQNKRGNYYQQQAQLAPWRLFPANVRSGALTHLMSQGGFGPAQISQLNPQQQQEAISALQSANNYYSLPVSQRMARIKAVGADKIYHQLVDSFKDLQKAGLQTGIPGQTQLESAKLRVKGGGTSNILTKYQQTKQLENTLSKLYMSVSGMRNTDAAAKTAHSVVENDIMKNSWPQIFARLNTLGNLLGTEEQSYQGNPITSPGTAISPSPSKTIRMNFQGKSYEIDPSNVEAAKKSGFKEE